MQLILKKADSSTNLLLFIYKFYRNFADGDKNEIQLPLILELMKAFGKNEAAVRMSLSRAVRSGLFESRKAGKETYYSPTLPGQQLIEASVRKSDCFLKRYGLRHSAWDGKWFCVNVPDTKDSEKENRLKIVQGLRLLGFSPMRDGVWLSPYNMLHEFRQLMLECDCRSSVVATHGEMIVDAGFGDFLEKVFKLKRYAGPYKKFIASFEGRLIESRKPVNAGNVLAKEFCIPLFYELGHTFFDLSFQDPFLPKAVLPEWEGDRAAAIALELFKLLTPSLRYHFRLNSGLEA